MFERADAARVTMVESRCRECKFWIIEGSVEVDLGFILLALFRCSNWIPSWWSCNGLLQCIAIVQCKLGWKEIILHWARRYWEGLKQGFFSNEFLLDWNLLSFVRKVYLQTVAESIVWLLVWSLVRRNLDTKCYWHTVCIWYNCSVLHVTSLYIMVWHGIVFHSVLLHGITLLCTVFTARRRTTA